jgi:hypothetical protein
LINPGGTTPFTAAQAKTAVFGTANDYIKEASYGKSSYTGAVDPTGDVFGWFQVGSGCNLDTIASAAKSAAQAAGANLSQYNTFLYLTPAAGRSSCSFDGITSPSQQNALVINDNPLNYVVAHELGHTFGNGTLVIGEANGLNCGTVAIASSCNFDGYADAYTVMGNMNARSTFGHYSAPHKFTAGWLTAADVATVTASSTVTINTLEAASGVRAIRIPRGSSYLWVEVRGKTGFDATSLPAAGYTGVLLHTLEANGEDTDLVDMAPATTTYSDAPLLPGASVTDPVSGAKVTLVSRTDTQATVSVQIGSATPPPASSPPAVTPTISPSSAPRIPHSADINHDGTVNVFDLSMLLSKWATTDVTADINASGTVDVFDLSTLLNKWGTPGT